MPYVNLSITDVVTKEQKTQLVREKIDTLVRVLAKKVPEHFHIIIDEVDEEGAIGRSRGDAPEIDGNVFLNGETDVVSGDIVQVEIAHGDEYDLWGQLAAKTGTD